MKNDHVEKKYQAMFSHISPDPALLERTERKIEEMNKGYAQARKVILVAVAAVLVMGAALAAGMSYGILDRLFRFSGEPTQEAQDKVVQSTGIQAEGEGLTLTMDEYLADEYTIHLGWTVQSRRNDTVYYLTDYEIDDQGAAASQPVGGNYGAYGHVSVGDMTLVQLESGQAYSAFAGIGYQKMPETHVTAKVRIYAYTSDLAATKVSEWSENFETLQNGNLIEIDQNHLACISQYPDVAAIRDRLLAEGMDLEAAERQALVDSGYMKPLTQLEVEVVIPPAQVAASRFELEQPVSFEMPGRKVTMKSLQVGAASTTMEYEIVRDTPVDGMYFWYLIYDQNGRLLNVDCSLNMDAHVGDDNMTIQVVLFGNALPEGTTSLHFVPTRNLQRQEGESSNDFYNRMAEMASEEDCFILELK